MQKDNYSFSPIKIGHYTVSATAPKFATTTQQNITVNIQDVLNIPLSLKPGGCDGECHCHLRASYAAE